MSMFESKSVDLPQIIKDTVSGKLQLPDFQRGWVWDDEHIRSLLVSISRSFPIGAVMLLETGGEARFQIRPIEGLDKISDQLKNAELLILDGQQRLTSLTQVLALKSAVQTKNLKGKKYPRYYYIDMQLAMQENANLDEAIFSVDENKKITENFGRDVKLDLIAPEKEYEKLMFPCSQILNSDEWEYGFFNFHRHQPERSQQYMLFRRNVLDKFRDYKIPVIELKKENSKEAICLVFEKVNTGGVTLSVFELITATFAIDNINLRDEWFGSSKSGIKGLYNELSKENLLKNIQPTEFFQAISLLHTLEKRKKDQKEGKTGKNVTGVSAKRESVLSLPVDAYKKWKLPLKKGFETAAKFLRQKESLYTIKDLPYRTQLIPLAVILTLLDECWMEPKVYEKVARWYWCGVLGELYGGAVETRMALDVQEVIAWINSTGAPEPSTVRDANFQASRFDTLRTRNSAAYKGINVLIQRNGACDIFWKTKISDLREDQWDEQMLDIHHIFPVKWCENNGIHAKRYNSILNKTPISYKANRKIGGKAPSEYLKDLQEEKNVQLENDEMNALLETHKISPEALRLNDFEMFIEKRRHALAEEISKVIGKSVNFDVDSSTEKDDDDLDDSVDATE